MGDSKSGGISGFDVGFGRPGGPPSPGEVGERGPLRIVVLSELAAREEYATGPIPIAEPLRIDKVSFDRVMEQVAPSLAVEVEDPFTAGAAAIRVNLRFKELRSMRPDAIIDQVPVLRALVDARRIVENVKARKTSAADARAQLARILPRPAWADSLTGEVAERPADAKSAASKAAPAPAAKSNAIDDLFSIVDVGKPAPIEEAAPAGADDAAAAAQPDDVPTVGGLSAIVAAVAKSARKGERPPLAVVGSAPERVENAFRRVLSDIVEHPEVVRLEAAWRGLRLLIDNCDFRAGLEVDVIPVAPAKVEEALKHLAGIADGERAPIDVFVADYEVNATAAELERLERWGQMAEAYRAPVVVNGGASLLAAESVAAVGKAGHRLSSFDDPRLVAVRGIASRESARWVAVVVNRVLTRAPYDASTSRVKELTFEQDAKDKGTHVFSGGAYVIASLAARSHVKFGWPTAITGPRDGQLGNLPVHEVTDKGHTAAIPTEAFVTQEAQIDVARIGLCILASAPNSDGALAGKVPVLYRGPTAGAREDAPAESTLSNQLFIGRLANAVDQLAAAIPNDTPPAAASDVAKVTLAELFPQGGASGPLVDVKIDAAKHRLEVTVKPRRFAGVSLEEITLGATLG